jgi:hypothetical protein
MQVKEPYWHSFFIYFYLTHKNIKIAHMRHHVIFPHTRHCAVFKSGSHSYVLKHLPFLYGENIQNSFS